jgi:hypothetical protein
MPSMSAVIDVGCAMGVVSERLGGAERIISNFIIVVPRAAKVGAIPGILVVDVEVERSIGGSVGAWVK